MVCGITSPQVTVWLFRAAWSKTQVAFIQTAAAYQTATIPARPSEPAAPIPARLMPPPVSSVAQIAPRAASAPSATAPRSCAFAPAARRSSPPPPPPQRHPCQCSPVGRSPKTTIAISAIATSWKIADSAMASPSPFSRITCTISVLPTQNSASAPKKTGRPPSRHRPSAPHWPPRRPPSPPKATDRPPRSSQALRRRRFGAAACAASAACRSPRSAPPSRAPRATPRAGPDQEDQRHRIDQHDGRDPEQRRADVELGPRHQRLPPASHSAPAITASAAATTSGTPSAHFRNPAQTCRAEGGGRSLRRSAPCAHHPRPPCADRETGPRATLPNVIPMSYLPPTRIIRRSYLIGMPRPQALTHPMRDLDELPTVADVERPSFGSGLSITSVIRPGRGLITTILVEIHRLRDRNA